MFSSSEMSQAASSMFSAYASLAGYMMLIRTMFNDFVPQQLRSYISDHFRCFFAPASKNLVLIIDDNAGMIRNQVFDAAEIYLRTKISPKVDRLKVSKTPRQMNFTVSVDRDEEIYDRFEDIDLIWRFMKLDREKDFQQDKRFFELSFDKRFKERVMDAYLPHVLARAEEIKRKEKVVKLFSRAIYGSDDDDSSGDWGSVNLEHPSTFETLAMDPELKKMIIDDLERFVRRRELYKKVGKAWKRGYLLYGPPGTGKSSLVAAMANYLKFDVFDLELTSVYDNSDLKRILLSTTNRSILVIEDIDCSAEVKDRAQNGSESDESDEGRRKITLSGILNFIDGLWSSCGDERIIVFTTNHKERLDPALLRPGRMDIHINLSYCTIQGFRILVSNYLGLDGQNHPLCHEIEILMEKTEVTPAEIAEELLREDDPEAALRGLLRFLEEKEEEKIKSVEKDKMIDCDIKKNVSEIPRADDDDDEKKGHITHKRRKGQGKKINRKPRW